MKIARASHAKSGDIRELTSTELEAIAGGRDYNLGFGIHLVVIGDYVTVYTACYKMGGIEVCPA